MKKDLGDAPLALGGWLILVGIRLIGGFLLNVNSVTRTFSLNLDTTGQIIRILQLLFIVYALVVLSLFFKRHKVFPSVYIGLEAFFIILNISTFFISFNNTITWKAFWPPVAGLLIGILWILYILLSKRVKKTFLYRWNETLDRSLVDKANGMEVNR